MILFAMFFLLGTAFITFGLHRLVINFQLMKNGVRTTGRVNGIEECGSTTYITVSFQTRKGEQMQFDHGFGYSIFGEKWYLDKPIPVRYDPNNLRRATIDTVSEMWGLSISSLVLGITFLTFSIFK